MAAAPAAIPPNPKSAAISATTKNIKVQRNISSSYLVMSIHKTKPYQMSK